MVETRQQTRNKMDTKKAEPNKEVIQVTTVKGEAIDLAGQTIDERHTGAGKMTDKVIHTILSNNIDKLPKFAGRPEENINKWLVDITNELNMAKLDDDQKRMVIQTFLIEDARKWFINNMSDMLDWPTFTLRIQKAFSSAWLQEMAIKKVGTRQQAATETVLHYHNDMMELFDMIDVNMTDQLKVIYLKTGLKISLKKEVSRRNPKTVVEFLEIAQAEEQLDYSINVQLENTEQPEMHSLSLIGTNGRKYNQGNQFQQQRKNQHHQQQNDQQPKDQQGQQVQQHQSQWNQQGQAKTSIRCHRCNRVGHFARNCFSKNF